MRLNGWQRLWCVGAMLLLVYVARDAYLHAPTADKIRREFELQAVQRGLITFPWDVYKCQDATTDEAKKASCGRDQTPQEKAEYARESKAAEDRIKNELLGEQLQAAAEAAALWLAVSAVLYAAGWAIGWIIRGFRKPETNSRR